MNRGYIKLWRKSKDSGFLGNADVWQLLSWCLLTATHRARRQIVGKQLVDLRPGQLIFGRISVAKELNSTEKKIRNALKLLENADFLSVQRASKYSIITVVNWQCYQEEGPAEGQQKGQHTGQQGASKGPAEGHKQECKTHNTGEDKEDSYESFVGEPSPTDTKQPRCPHDELIAMYHEQLPELPEMRVRNDDRDSLLRTRWRESGQRLVAAGKPPTKQNCLAWWRKYFARVRASPLLMGQIEQKGRDSPWMADFEWLIRPKNFAKVIEGRYLDRSTM